MQDCKELDVLAVVTTVGSADDARALARAILDRRLAACVQVEPTVTSHFRWKGQSREEPEWRLTIKTLPSCEAQLQALFDTEHPYELPQFLATLERASAAYAQWVRSEVEPPATM